MSHFRAGDRAPGVIGATLEGRFHSPDAQAGRPAVLVSLGTASPESALAAFGAIRAAHVPLLEAGADLIPLAPQAPGYAGALCADADARRWVVQVALGADLSSWSGPEGHLALVIDRSGRIVQRAWVRNDQDLLTLYRPLAGRLRVPPSQRRTATAPVLLIPNVAPPALCEALIAHFEASPHRPGLMAGLVDGAPGAKLDAAKKHRRDIELTPDSPLHPQIVELFAERVAPEIRRAFQSEITFADRILIARYDDTGGYFRRHRDDMAPQTAFREFAVSLNLNTHEYEGGELLFPEFDDDRYSPPAGAAAVFSASLLHEAAPVTRGARYVLLSFLCSAAAQAKMMQAA